MYFSLRQKRIPFTGILKKISVNTLFYMTDLNPSGTYFHPANNNISN